ncbi:MAG: hypothetical protein D6693_07630 [Planctomycetota bacterium]|nr:MAG: hypothetical protein D6693_07630 [Planctomycetota bacterium]
MRHLRLLAQLKHDQEASEPAVAVLERVDRLELVVQQREADQPRQIVGGREVGFERVEAGLQFAGGRRDVARLFEPLCRSDRCLSRAEVSDPPGPGRHALHQDRVHLTEQPQTQRQL